MNKRDSVCMVENNNGSDWGFPRDFSFLNEVQRNCEVHMQLVQWVWLEWVWQLCWHLLPSGTTSVTDVQWGHLLCWLWCIPPPISPPSHSPSLSSSAPVLSSLHSLSSSHPPHPPAPLHSRSSVPGILVLLLVVLLPPLITLKRPVSP